MAKFTPAILVLLLSAGCARLQPVELPPEYAEAPAEAPLWSEIRSHHSEDWFVLLSDGRQALDWRLQAIDDATRSIDLQTFLWGMDAVGTAIIDHLLKAADRGVKVRVLVDDTFLLGEDQQLMYLQNHPNFEYRVFNPYLRRSSGFASRQALNLAEFHRLDHRMHNKSMIVDQQVAIVGGRNLADEYFGLHENANFRDLELLVGGQVVNRVSNAFDLYWNDRWSVPLDEISHVQQLEPDLSAAAQVLGELHPIHAERSPSSRVIAWLELLQQQAETGSATLLVDEPPVENPANAPEAPVQVANELARIVNSAQQELIVISAYLIPSEGVEELFAGLIARGVKVTMLTNSISSTNHISAHSAYRKHVGSLLGSGVDLYEVKSDAEDRELYMLSPTEQKALSLHAKAIVIDDKLVGIGSPNLDPRSLRINTEMGLLVDSESLNRRLRESLQPDFAEGNAWQLQVDGDGKLSWVSGSMVLSSQPANGFMQRIEDWFFGILPLEDTL